MSTTSTSDYSTECNNILTVYGLNASSFGDKEDKLSWPAKNVHSGHEGLVWTAGQNDPSPWVELGLADKSSITGRIEPEFSVRN